MPLLGKPGAWQNCGHMRHNTRWQPPRAYHLRENAAMHCQRAERRWGPYHADEFEPLASTLQCQDRLDVRDMLCHVRCYDLFHQSGCDQANRLQPFAIGASCRNDCAWVETHAKRIALAKRTARTNGNSTACLLTSWMTRRWRIVRDVRPILFRDTHNQKR